MDKIIEYCKNHLIAAITLGSLITITIYSIKSVLLNKLNNVKCGKTTIFAWILVTDIFLLGKLVVHWTVGIILVLGLLFGVVISFNIPKLEFFYTLLPSTYVLIYQILYIVIILVFFVFAKIRLNQIIREGTSKDAMNEYINKDFTNKEPEVTVNDKPIVTNTNINTNTIEHGLSDNFQYNNSPLNNTNNVTNEESKTINDNNQNS